MIKEVVEAWNKYRSLFRFFVLPALIVIGAGYYFSTLIENVGLLSLNTLTRDVTLLVLLNILYITYLLNLYNTNHPFNALKGMPKLFILLLISGVIVSIPFLILLTSYILLPIVLNDILTTMLAMLLLLLLTIYLVLKLLPIEAFLSFTLSLRETFFLTLKVHVSKMIRAGVILLIFYLVTGFITSGVGMLLSPFFMPLQAKIISGGIVGALFSIPFGTFLYLTLMKPIYEELNKAESS